MKKPILLFAITLLFLSGCQSSTADQNSTLTPVPDELGKSPDGIIYRPVVVEGLTEIQRKEGEGIELDLDGDGTTEQLYTCEEGIFINGIKQEMDFMIPASARRNTMETALT